MKIKKILSLALVITIVFSLFATNVSLPVSAAGTNYYVDAVNGNDSYSGLSEAQAFKTLGRIQNPQFSFSPGDRINLKRGCTWNENLVLRGSGTSSNVCYVQPYGSGAKPKIKGSGFVTGIGSLAVVGGLNLSYWNINNIQVELNYNQTLTSATATLVGIEFYYTAANGYNWIAVDSVDVYGYGVNTNTYGIRYICVAPGDYDGFLTNPIVQNCNVYNVGWAGIMLTTWNSSAQRNMHVAGPFHNAYLYNNIVHDTGVHGITLIGCTTGDMKNNYVYSCGTYTGTGQTWGAVGIWCMVSSYINIWSNTVFGQSDSNNGYDAAGIDVDWSCYSVNVSYNICRDNKGPGIETMANNQCTIFSNTIYNNQCATSVGNGQISLSDYTGQTGYITGVNNLKIHSNQIYVNNANTAAISTKKFTAGTWSGNQFYNNSIRFTAGAYNTHIYSFDTAVGYQPFSYCDYNYIYGTWYLWYGVYQNVVGSYTKQGWTQITQQYGGVAYDANTTLN